MLYVIYGTILESVNRIVGYIDGVFWGGIVYNLYS